MIQPQKYQNWSKFLQKLPKKVKISMMSIQRIFFRILKIIKMGVNNEYKKYSVSSSFVIYND
jgi:hypothetical protein